MAYVISLGQKLELKPSISEQCDACVYVSWLSMGGPSTQVVDRERIMITAMLLPYPQLIFVNCQLLK